RIAPFSSSTGVSGLRLRARSPPAVDRHRGCDGRGPNEKPRRMTMANIGTFTKAEDGSLSGTIKTLQLNTKARFVPLAATSNGGPDFRIFAGNVEIGAAWSKLSQQERPYTSV